MTRPAKTAQPVLRLSIQFGDASHRKQLARPMLARWVRAALRSGPESADDASGQPGSPDPHQITLRFVDAEEGRALNRAYRGKDHATNVLTFDYSHWPVQADIVLCSPVVEQEAQMQRKPLQAHYAHLVVHGVLHALGWDHQTEDEARAMEQREVAVLAALGVADPYADGADMPAG